MRIGNPTNNEYFLRLNDLNQKIQDLFLIKINDATRTVSCAVMLGDSTTKKIDTFDISNVINFISNFTNIQNWSSQGMSNSNDEDLRRVFTKSEIKLGCSTFISCIMSSICISRTMDCAIRRTGPPPNDSGFESL